MTNRAYVRKGMGRVVVVHFQTDIVLQKTQRRQLLLGLVSTGHVCMEESIRSNAIENTNNTNKSNNTKERRLDQSNDMTHDA